MTAELVCSASDPAWLDKRREGITATDIVTIAGLVTWDSPWALYHRKLGLLPEPEQSDRMRLGQWLEEAMIGQWWVTTPEEVTDPAGTGGLYRSNARPWQMATPDALTGPDEFGPPTGVLECKTWDERQGKQEWGPDGSGQVPAKVRAQVLWQMDTLGVGAGHVAVVFLPSGEFRSYTIRHSTQGHCELAPDRPCQDVGLCTACVEIDGLRDLGFGFWSRILRREPPDMDGLEVTTDALRFLHPAPGGQIEFMKFDVPLVGGYDRALEAEAATRAHLSEMKNRVREAMGSAHEATVDGRVVFRRTIGKRAGYTVPPGETDVLRRIGKDKDA